MDRLLKNNNSTAGGNLKKVDGQFIYEQYAQYWIDTFDHLGFMPDYLSIQNEPGYSATWTSCVWRPSETADYPGYDTAIDAVYNAIKDRPEAPLFIGTEVISVPCKQLREHYKFNADQKNKTDPHGL